MSDRVAQQAIRLFLPLPDIFRKLFADLWISKGLAAALASAVTYFLPGASYDLAIGAYVLICLDTMTGFWASVVTGHKITSARLSRVLTKLFGYGSVVVVCSVAAHSVPGAEPLHAIAVSGVCGWIILTEGVSILENVGKMGVTAPPFLLGWLRKRLADQGVETELAITDKPEKG